MDEREKSCEARIGSHMRSREADLNTIFAAINGEDVEAEDLEAQDIDPENVEESAQERLYELPLGISTYRVMRIELSTGGPADWLEIKLSKELRYGYSVDRVTYHFADWFDHAERTVDENSSLWVMAEQFAETLAGSEDQ